MVKVNGPMFSFSASGTLADTATFSTWKGRPYVRQRVIPHNPKSDSQTGMRQMLAFLSQAWNGLSDISKSTWEEIASQAEISPFNAFCSYNLRKWRDYLAPSQQYPATRDDTNAALGTLSLAQIGQNIQVTQAITSKNDGWNLIIHKSTTTGFTPGFSTSVKTIALPTSGDAVTEIGPFQPGTYYVRTISGTVAGNRSPAVTEESITIT